MLWTAPHQSSPVLRCHPRETSGRVRRLRRSNMMRPRVIQLP